MINIDKNKPLENVNETRLARSFPRGVLLDVKISTCETISKFPDDNPSLMESPRLMQNKSSGLGMTYNLHRGNNAKSPTVESSNNILCNKFEEKSSNEEVGYEEHQVFFQPLIKANDKQITATSKIIAQDLSMTWDHSVWIKRRLKKMSSLSPSPSRSHGQIIINARSLRRPRKRPVVYVPRRGWSLSGITARYLTIPDNTWCYLSTRINH